MMRIKLFLFLIMLFGVGGCYSLKKAEKDLFKIKQNHGIILTKYCSETFPIKYDSIKEGNEVITTDTLYIVDSVDCPSLDSVSKPVRVPCPPSKIINNREVRVDTFYVENKALLDLKDSLVSIERGKRIATEAQRDKSRGLNAIFGLVILSLIALFVFKR